MDLQNFPVEREKNGTAWTIYLGGFNKFLMHEPHRRMDFSSHAKTLEGDLSLRHQRVTGTNEIQQINAGKQNAIKSNPLKHEIVNDTHSREEYFSSYAQKSVNVREGNANIRKTLSGSANGIYEEVVSKIPNKMETTDACLSSIAQCLEQHVHYHPKAIQESNRPKDFDHLLHVPSSNQDECHSDTAHYFHHFLQLGQDYLNLVYKQEAANFSLSQNGHFPYQWRRATQYHEAGIKFRRRAYFKCRPHSLLDIKFRDAVLEIPFLFVDESTSSLFRNLIALEQTSLKVGNDVTTYILFFFALPPYANEFTLFASSSGTKDSFSEGKAYAIARPLFHPPYITPCAGHASIDMKGEIFC
uniref:Uncharacterized protein n=1 Tax=Oryza punctata TaxID=4537 RepID=A0A0E0KZI3_ORYPU